MRKLKVSLKEPISGWELLDVQYMYEDQEGLNVIFHGHDSHHLEPGQRLSFRRNIWNEDGSMDEYSEDVTILAVTEHTDESGVTHDSLILTLPKRRRLSVTTDAGVIYTYWDYDEETSGYVSNSIQTYDASLYVQAPDNEVPDVSESATTPHVWTSAMTTNGAVFHSFQHRWEFDLEYYISVSGVPDGYDGYCESCFPDQDYSHDETVECYILNFTEDHGIFPQDLYCLSESGLTYDLDVMTYDGNYIGRLYGVQVPYETEPFPVEMDASYVSDFVDGTCGIVDEDGVEARLRMNTYYFSRPMFSRRKLIVMSAETSYISSSITDTQATYNRRMLDFLVTSGYYFTPRFNPYYSYSMTENGVKECYLWEDCWWDALLNRECATGINDVWERDGVSMAALYRDSAYWRVQVGLACDTDFSGMWSEEAVGEYMDKVEASLIPETIDMERVKYTPVAIDGDTITEVTSITFNFHFRKRAEEEHSITNITYPVYKDGWYIDPVSAATQWWNGMPYYGSVFNHDAMAHFMDVSGSSSDMLGFLSFTDDDVFYRKQRLSKTFVRLSYYTTNEAVSQKMAGYSTTFMDATTLYGQYLRQYQVREDKHRTNIPLVFFDNNSMSARLDTHITLTGEQDKTKSGEGFNIYLYKQDADSDAIDTLYMKVEFNHAGYGKTIPVLQWPMSGDTYIPLTTSNFLESLYIPVSLHKIDGRYLYEYPTAEHDGQGNLVFNLFEPKLDVEQHDNTVHSENIYSVTTGSMDDVVEQTNNPHVF